MNILHLNPELNITCGVSKSIYYICKELKSEANHSIICFGGDAIDNFLREGLRVIVIRKPSSILSYTFLVFSLIKLIHFHKIDIIHSHHRIFDSLSFIIQFFVKVKTVTSVHSKVIGKKMFSYKADKLIAVSKTISNHLITYYHKPESKIKLINNFVSEGNLLKNNEVKFHRKNQSKKTIILFVGRLSLEKGVDILLEAIKIIREKFSNENFLLQMIGNGPLKEYCSNFIHKYQLPASIIEPTNKIEPYYRQADIVVLPSRVDPFPSVMLEAGLFQKPFIGSNIDGMAELIRNEETGILCEPENANKLAEAIQKFIENEKFARTLAKNLHFIVKKSYTADNILPKYEKLYLELYNG